jgi:protein SCO1/2
MNAGARGHGRLIVYLTCAGLVWLEGGCGPGAGPPASAPPAVSAKEGAAKNRSKGNRSIDYQLRGVVKRVNLAKGSLMIAHEAIPGFMDAMTMPFFYNDRDFLENLASGDEVEGTLHVVEEDGVVIEHELRDLKVAKPAVRSMVFEVSKGKVSFREAPKQLEPGDAVPDFSMTTQEGKPLKLSDLRGSVVVLTFIYTRCPLPDFCPLMDRKFAELAGRAVANPVRAQSIRLISLSFDPEHDTPEVLAKHAKIRGAAPPLWMFAVASHEELNKIGRPLGLFYGPTQNEIAHNLCTAVIDREGKLARLELGAAANKWENVDLLKTIYSLIPPPGSPRKR